MSMIVYYDVDSGTFNKLSAVLNPEKHYNVLLIHAHFDTLDELRIAVPKPQGGDCYSVGETNDINIYDSVHRAWVSYGALTGVKGDPGKDGDSFTYEDFTPEQLDALKVKGDKGDSFTYEDFTPEQLEALKVKGDPGKDGARWFNGTAIVGTETSISAPTSGIVANVGDYYLNNTTGSVYECIVGGDANAAVWKYCMNLLEASQNALSKKIDEHNANGNAHSALFGKKADLLDGKVKAEQASSIIVTTSANTTLSATHAGKCIVCSNSSAITITIPSSVFEIGTEIEFIQNGAGTVTFAAASGVTLLSKDGFKTSNGQYSVVVCKQIASNTWILSGSLA